MRTIGRMFWAIPSFFIRMIFGLIWNFLKLGLVLAFICLLLLTYTRSSNSETARSLSGMISQVETFLQSRAASDMTDTVGQILTDSYQPHTDARWSTRQATVYIASTDQTFRQAYQDAIANWNATGVFTLTLIDDQATADIVASDYSDPNTKAAGVANTLTDSLTNNLRHADVLLNSYYLLNDDFGYSYDRILHTAEHELGHAIGLAHDDSQTSVMESSGSYHGIQDTDIATLNQLYENVGI